MEINIEALVYGLILLSISLIAVYVIIKNSWGYYFSKPDPSSLGIGGKWGSYIKFGHFKDFAKDVSNGDFIFLYDPKVFTTYKYVNDPKSSFGPGKGTFYPMWDNAKGNNHDFLAINVYGQNDYIIDYKVPSIERLERNILRPFDHVIILTQYAKGENTYKDKLLPLLAMSYNSTYEIFGYNTEKEIVYIIEQADLKELIGQHSDDGLKNLIYIGPNTYNVEKRKFPGVLPWTFNWEGVRVLRDLVCTLPSKRTQVVDDEFKLPKEFIDSLNKHTTKALIKFY